ncbi:ubiquitin-like domain-containing protein [Streptomyces sp. NPDC050636]|uniref:ubiquitin-like domain-containing protein n=1 Tax=Streptomyces sp. NPDC050636 TaxID=3154510 RepID=UPI00342A3085
MSHSQSSHRAARSRRGRSTTPPKNPYELKTLTVPRGLLPRQAAAPETSGTPATGGPPPGSRAAARRAAGATGRRRRPAERPETLRRLLPRALVVAFLAGGTTAFIAHDKAIRLSVDGDPRTLHTFADDVDDLLEAEHQDIGRHDIVAPAPGTALTSGDEVVIRHGRPVVLTLDGERRQVWTTAETVDGALRQLGVRAEGAYLSSSRSRRIGPHGLELAVRTERSVVFIADGREYRVRTNAATVREALEEAGLALRDEDTTSVPPDSFPREGQTVSVLRITGSRKVREEPVPFRTVKRSDPQLTRGTEAVVQQGRPGVRRVTYRLRTVNGVKQKPRRVATDVVRAPRPQIVHIGTKELPTSVGGADHLAWGSLAQCEAGGRPNAVDASGTYGGLYQFDVGTWHRLGGSGRPQDAPAQEQTYRAKKLYVTRGASPWPVCGRKLHQ